MAIQVQIMDATMADGRIHLALQSTNDDRPGETQKFSASFEASLTALQIKASVDAQVTLLWQALSNREWVI